MVVNALLQGFRVTVNGVDVTRALNGDQWLSLSRPKISEDGLFPATGTLLMLPVAGFSSDFFNPRKNRAQWLQGNPVIIEMQLGTGAALERVFTGYILQRPATPTDNAAGLALSIGDELVLRDIDTPAGDRAGVTLGLSFSRTDIIANIVTASEWAGSWIGSIPDYPLNYPLPKHQGSYVQQMGAIAASAGYGLYCDRQGNLNAVQITLNPTPLIARTHADLPILRPVDGSDTPAPKVQAAVSGREVDPTAKTNTYVVTEQGITAVDFSPAINGGVTIGLSDAAITTGIRKRTTFTEEWIEDCKKQIQREEIEQNAVDTSTTPSTVSLELRRVVETCRVYSADITGKLQTVETITYISQKQAAGAGPVVQSGSHSTQMLRSRRVLETWTYDGEVPASHEVKTYGILIAYEGAQYVAEERLESTALTEWIALAGDRWQKVESLSYPSLGVGGTLNLKDGSSTVSIGPEFRPAEPQRHVPTHTTKAVDCLGVALFEGIASTETETPIFEFEYGCAEGQADRLAELHGAILAGRDTGWECQVELTPEWFSLTPASAAQITLPDGTIGLFLIDGANIVASQNQCFASFACIDLGSLGTAQYQRPLGQIIGGTPVTQPPAVTTTTALIPPYTPVATGRIGGRLGFRGSSDPSSSPPVIAGRIGGRLGARGDTPIGMEGRAGGRLGVRSTVV